MSAPVAYRIKDYGDGWILQETLTDSERAIYAEQGNVVQALVPADRLASLEREMEELRARVIEECATVAENWRRKKTGRDLSKASFDPCGRWEGGEIYEEGKERVLIAAAIRRIKPSEAEGMEG